MNQNTVLIVYSVKGTSMANLDLAKSAISSYRSPSGMETRCQPRLFDIPTATSPGSTLASDLNQVLKQCVGAVVFVDQLRPNIVYELGFLHGQGRPVLLLTEKAVAKFWKSVSDLAGSAVANFTRKPIQEHVHSYLDQLHKQLSKIQPWPLLQLPSPASNRIAAAELTPRGRLLTGLEWGNGISVQGWPHVDLSLGLNPTRDARFNLMLKGTNTSTAYTIYFDMLYFTLAGERKRIWLGMTCNGPTTDIGARERTVPAKRINKDWHFITGRFIDLAQDAILLDVDRIEHIERVRFRAGKANDGDTHSFTVGYVNVMGIQH